MNAPVRLAQLSGTSPQGSSNAKDLKIAKPQNGQAVTVHLDGATKIDFGDISSEKLTFVRIGDRLIILFDNQSTVSIDPVFSNTGAPLPDVSFGMAADRVLDGNQFAELFPITTDQSVLPAAGTPGAPSVPAGANFGAFTIDALGGGTPLALLAGEDAGSQLGAADALGNSVPIPGTPDSVILNEDGLSEGVLGGPGDTGGALTSFTGSLHVNFGTDFVGRSLSFAATQPGLAGLTSGGQEVHLQVTTVGGQPVLIGYIGDDPSIAGNHVFTVSLDADSTIEGTYTVTLLLPLDHSVSGTEDTVSLTIGLIATDGSGDSASFSLVINVNDDSPVAAPVDAIGIAEQTGEFSPPSELELRLVKTEDGFLPTTEKVVLGISWGADNGNSNIDGGSTGTVVDGDRSLVFADTQIATLEALNLTSNGETIHYALSANGTEIVATAGGGEEGGRTIFTVSLSDTGTGSYTFTLSDNIDHNGASNLSQPLTFGIVATDADGDSIGSAFTVNIGDDVPSFGEKPDYSQVDEDGLGNAGNSYPDSGDAYGEDTTVTDTLGIRWGSDDANTNVDGGITDAPVNGDRAVTFASGVIASLESQSLTSNGFGLHYELSTVGTELTAYRWNGESYVDATGHVTEDPSAAVVFTVTLSDQDRGSYTFDLVGNLDHPVAGTEDDITLTLGFVATDSDGDAITDTFTVKVNDDAPRFGEKVSYSTVDEDGLGNPGNSYADSNDAYGANLTVTDYLGIRWGADSANSSVDGGIDGSPVTGDRSVTFAADVVGTLQGQHLTSNGFGLTYVVSADGTLLTAYRFDAAHERYVDGNGQPTSNPANAAVFTVALSDQGQGAYTFTLLDNLDHPIAGTEDTITLNLGFVATDSDGDAVGSTFTIKVNDDAPVLKGAGSGANLIVNGDFSGGEGWASTSYGSVATAVDGWTIGGAGGQLERVASGYLGATSPTGGYMVDLDASPGDVTLTQTVSGLTTGETYHLSFDIGEATGSYDARLEVYWNGTLIGTYTPNTGAMQTIDLAVVAAGGNNTLSFKEVGAADYSGTFLANVSLRGSDGVVDEDGLATGLAGGPGDVPGQALVATGDLGIAWGADNANNLGNVGITGAAVMGDRAVTFASNTAATLTAQHLSSNGVALTYVVSEGGTLLTAYRYDGHHYVDGDGHTTSNPAAAAVFTVKLSDLSSGSYTFTLLDNLDHPVAGTEDSIALTLNYVATDSDGDKIGGVFKVNVNDDSPVAQTGDAKSIGEAALGSDGGDCGPGFGGSDPDSSVSGALNIKWGADNNNSGSANRSVGFTSPDAAADVQFTTANGAPLSGLTSDGETVKFAFDHGVLVGYTGSNLWSGERIFEVSLSDTGTGSYTFTLLGNLDHPAGNGTNVLNLTFAYTATDSDGDSSNSSFTVTVVDDVPTIGSPDNETVAEANLPTDYYDTYHPDSPYSTVQTGGLDISWGADDNDSGATNNRSVGFTTTTAPSGLTSNGYAISYSLSADGTLLTATSSDHRTVFTVSLNDDGDGSYKFTLYDNVDHSSAGADSLALTFGFKATDSDGDTATSSFKVTIVDDVPTIGYPDDETVSEVNLPTTGYDTDHPDASNSTVQTGDLEISWGADDSNSGVGHNRSVTFTTAAGATGLTSDGSPISYSISTDGTLLTATSADNRVVFTIQLSDSGDGSYKFTLFDNIDHPVSGPSDDSLALTFGFKATDSDGDTATDSFKVTILDTTPVASTGDTKTVDEDDLSSGTDSSKEATTVTGDLNIAWGADDANPTEGGGLGDRSVAFRYSSASANVDAEDAYGHDLTLKSDGQTVNYTFINGTLVAYTGSVPSSVSAGNVVFTVSLSDQDDGSYTFKLLGNLDHPAGSGENVVNLEFSFTATDGDRDTSSNSFTVSIKDDVPVIGTPVGSTLTENTTGFAGAEVFQTQTASNVALNINWGADNSNSGSANRAIEFDSSIDTGDTVRTTAGGSPALTSNGVAVQFIRVSDTEIWGVANDNGGQLSLNDRKVFHITLSDDGSGSYTFELLDNVDHLGSGQGSALSLKLGFTATDSDGDSASANFTVTINDDNGRPSIGTVDAKTVDEDGLSGGNTASAPGDAAGANVAATGSLAISWGADDNNSGSVNRSVAFSGISNGQNASSDAGLLTVEGVQVKLWVVGNTLYGYTGSNPANGNTAPSSGSQVFKITLDDSGAGSYTFTLLKHVDHPTGQNENDVRLTIGFTATDGDGDTANASIVVTINDDSPVATATVLTRAVYESELHSGTFSTGTQAGNSDNKNGDSSSDDSIVTGNLSSLVSIGADSPGSFVVETTALSTSLTSLTSGGVALTYAVSGNTLTASAGGNVIFTFVVDANTGAYTFTLKGPLDHVGTGNGSALQLDLSTAVTARDSDGDTVALHDQLVITVNDDAPTFTAGNVTTGKVDEEGLGGNPGAPALYGASDLSGEATTASGGLGINWGADSNNTGSANRSLAFNGITEGAAVLDAGNVAVTSNGQALHYHLTTIGGQPALVGYVGADPSVASNQVFTVTLDDSSANGTYNFALLKNLDHPVANSEDNVTLKFGFTAKDADGDAVNGNFSVAVNDDAPTVATVATQTVTELTAPDFGNVFQTQTLSGVSLNISWGADAANSTAGAGAHDRSVAFASSLANTVPSGVTSNGYHLLYVLSPDGQTLTAYRYENGHYLNGAGNDLGTSPSTSARIFTVSLSDGSNGTYDFTLYDNLDQAAGNGANTLPLAFGFTATDSDGDRVSGSFTVQIKDDVPLVTGAAQIGSVDETSLVPHPTTFGDLNIDWNADDRNTRLTFTDKTITDGNGHTLNLTSGGVALDYTVRLAANGIDQELVAYKHGDTVDNPVFIATLNALVNPAYAFTLFQPLDHSGSYDNNLPLTFNVTGYDGDNDPVTTTFTVNVGDSTPQSRDVEEVRIEEAAGTVSTGAVDLRINFGGDGDSAGPSVTFLQAAPSYVHTQDGNAVSLTSLGVGLVYVLSADHTTLTAYRFNGSNYIDQNGASLGSNVANASDAAVFTVALSDGGTGSYTFTLLQPIDHPTATGATQYLDLNFGFQIEDGDHDTFANNFTVRVDAAGSTTTTSYTAPDSAVFVNLSDTTQTYDGQSVARHSATDRASVADKVVGVDRLGAIDQAYGGSGDDILIGGAGTNRLFGNGGDDVLIGGGGTDTLAGGAGNDTFIFTVGDGQDTVDGGADTDTQIINGTAAAEFFNINAINLGGSYLAVNVDSALAAAAGGNFEVATKAVEEWVVNGGGGGDTFAVTGPLLGTGLAASTLTINSGDGNDTLDLTGFAGDVRVVSDGGADSDTVKFGFNFGDATYTKVFAQDGVTLIGVRVTHNGVTDLFTNYESFVFADGTRTLPGVFNTPPEAHNDTVAATEDTPLTVALLDLLNNDSDVDGNALTITGVSGATHGSVALDGNGRPVFTPAANFSGVAGFDYTISDGNGGTATAHVTIDVAPKADAPVFSIAGGSGGTTPTAVTGEFQVTTASSSNSAVAALSDGGFIVTWQGSDTNSSGIFAQRYDADHHAVGNSFRVNTNQSGSQTAPSVAALADGGYVVTWTGPDTSYKGIFAQRYDAAGAPVGTEFNVTTSPVYQEASSVVGLANGGFVVTWHTFNSSFANDAIVGRLYSPSGVAGPEFTIDTGASTFPSVAALSTGGFIVTWTESVSGNREIFAQMYDASGAASGAQMHVNSTTSGTQTLSQVASLIGGGFVIVWESDGQDGSGGGVYAQRYDASGHQVGTETLISVSANNQGTPSVAALADGGFMVMWNSVGQDGYDKISPYSSATTPSAGVYAQRVGADGTLIGTEIHVTETSAGSQSFDPALNGSPNIVQLANGDIVASWFGAPGGSVYGRVFAIDAAGSEDTTINLPTINAAVTDTDGSESLRLLLTGYPPGASFGVGHAGTGVDAGKWVIDSATDIAALASHPLQMTPPANYNGSFTLSVTAEVTDHATLSDGHVHTDIVTTAPLTVNVEVTPVNDAPVIQAPDGVTIDEDTSFVLTGANAITLSDPDGDVPISGTVKIVNGELNVPGYGSSIVFSFSGLTPSMFNSIFAGSVFIPNANADGTAQIQISVSDEGNVGGGALTATKVITIDLNPVEDAPIAVNDTASATEDTPLVVTNPALGVLANDSDPDTGDTVHVVAGQYTTAGGGTVDFHTDGTYTYTPKANFNGTDSVDYAIRDNSGAQAVAKLTLNVAAVNDAPVIYAPTSATIDEDTSLVLTGGNAITLSDPDGDVVVSGSVKILNGQLTVPGYGAGSQFTFSGLTTSMFNSIFAGSVFTPDPNSNGLAQIQISVSDDGNVGGGALTASQTIVINVDSVDDAPTIAISGNGISYTENESLKAAVPSVTLGDNDDTNLESAVLSLTNAQDGDRLWLGFTQLVQGAAGTVSISGTTFHYAVTEGNGSIAVTLSGTASLQAYQTALQSVKYDSSSEAPSTVDRVISITVNDGDLSSAPATSVIHVTEVNDAPAVTGTTARGNEDTVIAVSLAGVDHDGHVANFQLAGGAANGTLYSDAGLTHVIGAGSLVAATGDGATVYFKPNADWNGSTSFSYGAIDDRGMASQSNATASITVDAVNDAPVAAADTLSAVKEDSGVRIISFASLLANDSVGPTNEAGQTLNITGLSNVVGGTAVISGTNILFTPGANFNGTAAFDYTVQDNGQTKGADDFKSAVGHASFAVTPVADAPVGTNKTVATFEDNTYTFKASDFGFTDPLDSPANNFTGVVIKTLPGAGTLTDHGVPVTAGSLVSIADINAGYLVFTPTANGAGNGYAAFTFQVQDDGGVSGQSSRLEFQLASGWTGTSGTNYGWGTLTQAPANSPDQTAVAFAESITGSTIRTDSAAQPNAIAIAGAKYHLTFDHLLVGGYGPTGSIGVDVYAGSTLIGHFTHAYNASSPTVSFDTTTAVPAGEAGHSLSVVFSAINTFALDNVSLNQIVSPGVYGSNLLVNGDFGSGSYYVGDNVDDTPRTMTIDVTPVNDLPLAVADDGSVNSAFRMTEDSGSATFDVRANDTLDVDAGAANTVTIAGVVVPTNSYGIDANDLQITVTNDNKVEVTLLGTDWNKLPTGAFLSIPITYTLHGDGADASTAQLTVRVSGVNDAPVLDAMLSPAITENQNAGAPVGGVTTGTPVSAIANLTGGGGLDNVSDVDGSIAGVAITAVNSSHGTWYWSANNGATWTAIDPASVSASHALLLYGEYSLYFAPAANYAGTVSDALTFQAWDRTSGTPGNYIDATVNGGTTSLSTASDMVSVTITDVTAPTLVSVAMSDTALKIGDTSTVTITFSEAVSNFDNTDVSVQSGTLSQLTTADGGITWTGTFTPGANITDATNVVTVASTYTDLANNAGTGGTSANYAVDTQAPTVSSVTFSDTALTMGETATVTINFSEAVTNFDNSDVTVENGSLSQLSSSNGGLTWTGTFTPTADINDSTNVITVAGSYTDAAGNAGGGGSSANYTINTVANHAPDFGSGNFAGAVTGQANVPAISVLVNGGFESGSTGWTSSSADGGNNFGSSFPGEGAHNFTANSYGVYTGVQAQLAQIVATLPGVQYTLAFSVATTSITPGADLYVSWNGARILAVDSGQASGSYHTFTATVTGTGSDTLQFAIDDANNPATFDGWYLDAVSLTPSTQYESTAGVIAFSDADATDTHTVTVSTPAGNSYIGNFVPTLDEASHQVKWTFYASDSALMAMSANSVDQTYTLTIDDGHGGVDTQNVTVTLAKHINSAPTVTSSAQTGVATEDASIGVINLVQNPTFELPDIYHPVLTPWTVSGAGQVTIYGSGANGSIDAATLDPNTTLSQTLTTQAGTTYTIDFFLENYGTPFIVSVNGTPIWTTSNVVSNWTEYSVTFTATSASTVLSFATTGVNGASVDEVSVQAGTKHIVEGIETNAGTITYTDADATDTHTVAASGPSFSWSGGSLTQAQINALTSASTFTLNATESGGIGSVGWKHSIPDSAIQFLAAGQTLTETYTVTIDDGLGGTTSQNVTITINGANEAPTGTSASIAVTEDVTRVLTKADFGYSDADGDAMSGVTITSLSANAGVGQLLYGKVAVTVGQFISAADIAAGMLNFAPTDNIYNGGNVSFGFTVVDSAGASDPTANTITIGFDNTNRADATSQNYGELVNVANNGSLGSFYDTGGTDTLRVANSSFATLTSLSFLWSDNNLELSWSSSNSNGYATVLDQYVSANAFENFLFQSNANYGGFSISGQFGLAQSLDNSVASTSSIVAGTEASDIMRGGSWTDMMFGNGGHDTLYGNGGNDLLVGGLGNDRLEGGAGDDVYLFGLADGNDTIYDETGTGDKIVIKSNGLALTGLSAYDTDAASTAGHLMIQFNGQSIDVEAQYDGTGHAVNTINFDSATVDGYALGTTDYTFNLTDGDDSGGFRTVSLSSGNNFVAGELDTANKITGGTGKDLIFGGNANDVLSGAGGSDYLSGGGGNDTLSGGTGNDTLRGGDGADTFKFAESGSTNYDSIVDYSSGEGDVIDLSSLLASVSGNRADSVRFVDGGNHKSLASADGSGTLNDGDLTLQVKLSGSWTDVATIKDTGANLTAGNDVIKLILDSTQAQIQAHV